MQECSARLFQPQTCSPDLSAEGGRISRLSFEFSLLHPAAEGPHSSKARLRGHNTKNTLHSNILGSLSSLPAQ